MRPETDRAKLLVKRLDLPAATQVDDARWEAFQLAHLNDDGMFRIEDKARQIAWSWTVAAEAVADVLVDTSTEGTVFVSINLEEAREKIRYARRVYKNLTVPSYDRKPAITADNVLGLEFDNGKRILSLPSRPPRGKARMHVVLDEFAHVQHDREVYTAALPVMSKGGRMRIGSSPMGARGMFWDISQSDGYPGYVRVATPWWEVRAFTSEYPAVGADQMQTVDRVARFGNSRIRAVFDNMLLDDFQQEMECMYVDEKVSFFSWDLIHDNQVADLKYWHVTSTDVAQVCQEIKHAAVKGEIEGSFVGGVDVGRKKDLTEIVLLGYGQTAPVRLIVSLDQVNLNEQETCIRYILGALPVHLMYVDSTGMGMHLAENLEMGTHAEGQTFTNKSKVSWASGVKIMLQNKTLPIPVDRDLAYQIHSIKRTITSAGNVVYNTEANESHHGDRFWALALAVAAHNMMAGLPSIDPQAFKWKR